MNRNDGIRGFNLGGIMDRQSILKAIIDARQVAIERGIEANTVVINKRLRYVKPFALVDKQLNLITTFPPMIMGMEVRFAPLPRGYEFIVCHADVTERARMEAKIKASAVKEFAEKLKEIIADNAYKFINYMENIDPFGVSAEQIDELYNKLYGAIYSEP